jgi:hypothetical protein
LNAKLALSIAMLIAGCQPALDEGIYSCDVGEIDGCPPGWHCRSDGLCYSSAAPLLDPCAADSECASGFCALSPDPMASGGYCSSECDDTRECGGLSPDALCIQERCLDGCERAADCPSGTGCYFAHQAMRMPPREGTCFALEDTNLFGTRPCMPRMNCPPPAFCIVSPEVAQVGVCGMLCTTDEHCPSGTECVRVLLDAALCLSTCESADPHCGNGLTCDGFEGEPGTYCMPPEWSGRSLPLPGPVMPPMP